MAPPSAFYMSGGLQHFDSVTGMMQEIPALSETTDQSFFTAATQLATQPQEDDDTQQDSQSQSQNPYDHLWGRLIPCNPGVNPIDLLTTQVKYSLGRNQTNDIVIAAPKISGQHCEINYIAEGDGTNSVSVLDLSSNGTYINGIKIGRGRHLRMAHGDELSCGVPMPGDVADDYRFIFRQSSAPIQVAGGFHAQYQFGETLGKGSFATVKKAFSKATGGTFAVKIIAKHRFASNPKSQEMFERELAILQNLRHHNITRLVEYFEDESTIYIVMEIVQGGELLDYIIKFGAVPEDQARIWTAQLVDAIGYTHSKNITHRDLKPENILLTSSEPKSVKLADFGLAKSVNEGTFLKTMCGTPSYLAPEVVLRNHPDDGYDFKVDCWSLGVIIYSMMTNSQCFIEDERDPLQERMRKRVVDWQNLQSAGASPLCIDFVSKLIVNNPLDRMSIEEARQHPWIRGIHNPPPPDWQGSQDVVEEADDDDMNSDGDRRSRGFTEPPTDGSWNNGSGSAFGSGAGSSFNNGFGNGAGSSFTNGQHGAAPPAPWYVNGPFQSRAAMSGFSNGSSFGNGAISASGSALDTPISAAPSEYVPTPKELEQCSQNFRNLNLFERARVDSMDTGSPTSTKYQAGGVMDEDSWQVLPDKAMIIENDTLAPRAVKSIPKHAKNADPIDRATTPKPRSTRPVSAPNATRPVSAPPPPPSKSTSTGTKRKAANDVEMDPESSGLSSAPPSESELPRHVKLVDPRPTKKANTGARAKVVSVPTGSGRQGNGATPGRLANGAAAKLASTGTPARAKPAAAAAAAAAAVSGTRSSTRLKDRASVGSSTAAKAKATTTKRRPANRIRAPDGSSDEEDETSSNTRTPTVKAVTTAAGKRTTARAGKVARLS